MMSQTGQQIIKIYISSNIARGKDNQAMKIGHLIEYNMRNILNILEKSYTKRGESSPGYLTENQD